MKVSHVQVCLAVKCEAIIFFFTSDMYYRGQNSSENLPVKMALRTHLHVYKDVRLAPLKMQRLAPLKEELNKNRTKMQCLANRDLICNNTL